MNRAILPRHALSFAAVPRIPPSSFHRSIFSVFAGAGESVLDSAELEPKTSSSILKRSFVLGRKAVSGSGPEELEEGLGGGGGDGEERDVMRDQTSCSVIVVAMASARLKISSSSPAVRVKGLSWMLLLSMILVFGWFGLVWFGCVCGVLCV